MKKNLFSLIVFASICMPFQAHAQMEYWTRLNGPNHGAIGSLAVHPNGSIFAVINGSSVWRTTDNGQSWQKMGVTNQMTTPFLSDIIIHKNTGAIYIYVGEDTPYYDNPAAGLYKSSDNGNSWIKYTSITSESSYSFVIDYQRNFLYAFEESGIYKISLANSVSAEPLWLGAITNDAHPPTDMNIQKNILYFNDIENYCIYKYNLNTNSRSLVLDNETNSDDPTGVAVDNSRSILYVAKNTVGVYMSYDDGTSWTSINNGLNTFNTSILKYNDVTQKLYLGTKGGGIYCLKSNSQTWSLINTGLENSTIYAITYSPSNGSVYAAAADGYVYKLNQQSGSISSPSLLYPYNNNTQTWHTINIHWTSVTGADTYSLQVSRNSSFTDLVLNQSGLTSNYYLTSFDRNRTYYWRVKAKQGSSVSSDWSDIWSFTTDYTSLISDLAPNKYEVAKLSDNKFYYTDREFVITSLPIELNNLLWIKTANTDDKSATSESFLSFNLSQSATIYVCYDSRGTAQPPDWLKNNFSKQSSTLGVSDKSNPMSVWKKSFSSGQVILGGNLAAGAAGAGSNYIVAIKFEANVSPTISGRVTLSNGTGVDGVTLTFSNGGGTATTSGGGYYSKTVAYGWTGTVVPAYDSYSFSPPNKTYNSLSSNQTLDFVATPPANPLISGRVTLSNGTGVDGVTLTFSNGAGTATSASDGTFLKIVPYGWVGTLTPNYDGYTFKPTIISVKPVTRDTTVATFTATPPADPIINGRIVLASGEGLTGVTILFTRSGGTAITNNSGNYSKQVKYGWKGDIKPEYGEFSFKPEYISVKPVTRDTSVANIIAAPPTTVLIEGEVIVKSTGSGLDGVAMIFSDGTTITTVNGGKYIREIPYGWSGNVKPQLKDYTFVPEYIQYPSLKRDTLNQNYLAAKHPNPEISGQVALHDGTGLAGVLITISGGIGTVVTDAIGNFKIIVPYGWTGEVIPSSDKYEFEPKVINCQELKNDLTNQLIKAVLLEIPTLTLKVKAPYDISSNFSWYYDRLPIETNRFVLEISLTKRPTDPPLKNIDLKASISGKPLKISFYGIHENYDLNGDELIDSIPPQKSFDLVLLATSEAYSVNQLNKELVVQIKSINGISTDIKYVDNVSLYFAKNKYNHPFSLGKDAYKFPNDKSGLSKEEVAYYLGLWLINPFLSNPINPLLYALNNSGGKCFGFSVTSGAYFLEENRKPVQGDVVTWEPTELAVLDHINEAQLSQCIWYNNLYNSLNWEVSSTYDKIIESFNNYYPTVIGMESNSSGHAILAINVIEFNKKGESYIGVYDPNHPGESYTVKLDRLKNIFSYNNPEAYLKFTAIPQSNYSVFALDALLNQFYSKLTDQMSTNDLKGYAAGCPVFLMLSNSHGQKLGYDKNGVLHREFEGTVLRAPTSSAINDSITIIYVSKNINCSVQINAFDEAKMSYEKFSASDDSCFTLFSLNNYQVTKDMVIYNDDSHPNLISVDRTGDEQIDYTFIVNPNASSVNDLITSKEDIIPTILSNYPNPFNSTTMVSYYLSDHEFIELNVYDLQGRQVKRLVNGFQGKGIHEQIWDGTNEANEQVCSGCYIIKLNHTNISRNRQVKLKRIMLIR